MIVLFSPVRRCFDCTRQCVQHVPYVTLNKLGLDLFYQ